MKAPTMSPGESAGIAGAATAAAHAGDEWTAEAHALALVFLTEVAPMFPRAFQTCHVRAFAEARGLRPAPDARAWGHIARRLKREKRIVSVGVGRSPDPRQHFGFSTEWRAA